MQWLRCILWITLRDREKNIDTCKHCCHQPPLEIMVATNRLQWFGHACRMQNSIVPKQIFCSDRPTDKKCPKTTPLPWWKNGLEEDVRTGCLKTRLCRDPVVEASCMAMDKIQWRGFIRDAASFASKNG